MKVALCTGPLCTGAQCTGALRGVNILIRVKNETIKTRSR